jgi:hypothetical protein
MLRRGFLEQTAGRLSGQGCKILLDSFASSPRPVRFAEIPYTFRQRHTGESKLDAAVMLEYLALIGDKLLGAYWWCATEVIGLLLVPAVIRGPGSARQACARGRSRRLRVLQGTAGRARCTRNETVLHSVARTAARL